MPVGFVYYIGWLNEMYCSVSRCEHVILNLISIDVQIAGGTPTFTRFSIKMATTNHTYSIKKAERDLKYKPLVPHEEVRV